MKNEINDTFYTRQEVARLLNIHPMTVYREIKRGKLKAYRVANDFRISKTDLEAYMADNKVKPEQE